MHGDLSEVPKKQSYQRPSCPDLSQLPLTWGITLQGCWEQHLRRTCLSSGTQVLSHLQCLTHIQRPGCCRAEVTAAEQARIELMKAANEAADKVKVLRKR